MILRLKHTCTLHKLTHGRFSLLFPPLHITEVESVNAFGNAWKTPPKLGTRSWRIWPTLIMIVLGINGEFLKCSFARKDKDE